MLSKKSINILYSVVINDKLEEDFEDWWWCTTMVWWCAGVSPGSAIALQIKKMCSITMYHGFWIWQPFFTWSWNYNIKCKPWVQTFGSEYSAELFLLLGGVVAEEIYRVKSFKWGTCNNIALHYRCIVFKENTFSWK